MFAYPLAKKIRIYIFYVRSTISYQIFWHAYYMHVWKDWTLVLVVVLVSTATTFFDSLYRKS